MSRRINTDLVQLNNDLEHGRQQRILEKMECSKMQFTENR